MRTQAVLEIHRGRAFDLMRGVLLATLLIAAQALAGGTPLDATGMHAESGLLFPHTAGAMRRVHVQRVAGRDVVVTYAAADRRLPIIASIVVYPVPDAEMTSTGWSSHLAAIREQTLASQPGASFVHAAPWQPRQFNRGHMQQFLTSFPGTHAAANYQVYLTRSGAFYLKYMITGLCAARARVTSG